MNPAGTEYAEPFESVGRPPPRRADDAPTSLPAAIADGIVSLITLGTFPPGFQLRQIELAERFAASRVALREALKLLTAQGIVAHDPNRGFFVAGVSSEEARQLYWIRRQLEAELLRTAQWPSKDRLAELRNLLCDAEKALRAQDTAGWLANHRRFYGVLFGLSPDRVLAQEVLRLIRLTDRYRALAPHALSGAARRATQERRLLNALAKHDRRRLLAVFETERTRIENGVQRVLGARGL